MSFGRDADGRLWYDGNLKVPMLYLQKMFAESPGVNTKINFAQYLQFMTDRYAHIARKKWEAEGAAGKIQNMDSVLDIKTPMDVLRLFDFLADNLEARFFMDNASTLNQELSLSLRNYKP